MRRSLGIDVISAAAALGVTTAVFTGTLTGAIGEPNAGGPGASSTGGSSSSTPPTTSTPPPVTTPPPTTPTTSATSATSVTSATSAPTTSAPSTTSATSATSGSLRTANLLQKVDFASVGWSTATLDTRLSEGSGQSVVGMCSAGDLAQLESAGAPVRGDYEGQRTSAEEVAVTFADEATASRAFDTVHRWLTECRLGTRPASGHAVTVGPDVPLDLDDAHDHGVWAYTDDDEGGVRGVMGILVVANRLAIVQVYDDAPKATTIEALLALAAKRLSPELTG